MVLAQLMAKPELLPGAEGDTLRQALQSMERSVQQIVTLVNDILFLQEMDLIMPAFQPTNIGMILQAVVSRYQTQAAQNKVELKLHLAPDLPEINGDSKSLERAFAAILDNAIKFSPNGGQVDIIARRNAAAGAALIVEFNDTGLGISQEILPRIFDRFFHVDQYQGHLFRGLGLGLSIARQVIEQHHGRIEVASEVGKGTRLTVVL